MSIKKAILLSVFLPSFCFAQTKKPITKSTTSTAVNKPAVNSQGHSIQISLKPYQNNKIYNFRILMFGLTHRSLKNFSKL